MSKAILIAIYDNTTRIDVKCQRGNSRALPGRRVVIIIGVLYQLENEARAAIVEVLGQPGRFISSGLLENIGGFVSANVTTEDPIISSFLSIASST